MDRKVENGVVVGIAYELVVDGETVDEADAADPVEYLHGAMNIVPGLETALIGHKVGDRLQVTVPPADAYGDYDPDDIEWFPREEFEDAEDLAPGMVLTVEDDDGDVYDVTVSEVTVDAVALDFNPPLAGKTLSFQVEIVSLRDADPDEIAQGHPYGDDWEDEDEDPVDEDADVDEEDLLGRFN